MMTTLILTVILILLAMGALAIGWLLQGKKLPTGCCGKTPTCACKKNDDDQKRCD